MASAIKMITLGVTEKMIVISGELVFMVLVWDQLVVMVVMAGCTWVAVVRFVSILISPFVLLLLVECVGEGLGP